MRLPTAYHVFRSKQGLVAVVEYGFDMNLSQKRATEWTIAPIHDIRDG